MRELLWAPEPMQPTQPRAIALYLHGGAVHSHRPVTSASAALRRSRWIRDALGPSLARNDIASVLLRFGERGWNGKDGDPAPIADARWALDRLRETHDLPIVLVGHSMGGRTGLHVADDPQVVGLVALAGWLPEDEDVSAIANRYLVVAHGTRDVITSAQHSRIVLERAQKIAASTSYVDMPNLGHYLLRGARDWHRLARGEVLRIAAAGDGVVTPPITVASTET